MGGRGAYSMTFWANSGVSNRSASKDVTSKYKGMTLAQAEDVIRGIKGHEEAVIFDRNMKVIAAYSGGSGSVGLPDSLKGKDGITITHNHPTGITGYGAVFSPSDISGFASSKASEIRAVGAGQGEYVYSIQVRGKQSSTGVKYAKSQLNLWAHSVKSDATPKESGGTGKLQDDYQKMYNGYRKQGMSSGQARHAAWQQATGKLERSLSDKAASLKSNGVIYYSKNKKYDVNR